MKTSIPTQSINPQLQVTWEAHQELTQEELDALEVQIQGTQLQLQGLLNNNAEWRTTLSDRQQEIKLEILGWR